MVHLTPMTSSEFEVYLEQAVKDYAQDKIAASSWQAEDALQRAKTSYLELLPDGVATKNQHLFTVKDAQSDANVGMIWFAEREDGPAPSAFIYDFSIDEDQRRKGYGSQTLKALEIKVRNLGLETLSLHVFGHNKGALALYQKLGFEMIDIQMSKRL